MAERSKPELDRVGLQQAFLVAYLGRLRSSGQKSGKVEARLARMSPASFSRQGRKPIIMVKGPGDVTRQWNIQFYAQQENKRQCSRKKK
jgi:hypothetical protein